MNNNQDEGNIQQPQQQNDFMSRVPVFDFTNYETIYDLGVWLFQCEVEEQYGWPVLAALFHHIKSMANAGDRGGIDVSDFCTHAIMHLYRGSCAFESAADKWADRCAGKSRKEGKDA